MNPPTKSLQRLSLVCSLTAAAIGTITIIGWASGMEALASLRANYIPMAPSTALAFAVLGIAMIAIRGKKTSRIFFAICVVTVGFVAIGKLVELISGMRLGLDEMLVADPAMFGAVRKGRMAPMTAMNFLVVGLAMASLLRSSLHAWAARLATFAAVVSIVVMIGYAYGTPLLYGGSIIPVALPTAVAFLLLSCSVIAEAGRAFWPIRSFVGDTTHALLMRWLMPSIVGATLLTGFCRTKLMAFSNVNPAIISALSTLFSVLVVSWIISRIAALVGRNIDRAEAERNAARAELEALNLDLENRISARTAELQRKNEQMEEELAMARELQMAMLPQEFPRLPAEAKESESAVRFFSFYYPTGAVSGDFFDVFPISDTSVGVFICDVMGHGVRAALVTSMMRALMEQHLGADPGELLSRMNRALISILKQTGTTLFATSFVLIADVGRSQISYANAGHPQPLHFRHRTGETFPLGVNGNHGPAMGLFEDAKYETLHTPLHRGDVVMLFTDGLFEVENSGGELFSQLQLLESVRKNTALAPEKLFPQILAEIRGFAGHVEFEDDVCLIGVEVAQNI